MQVIPVTSKFSIALDVTADAAARAHALGFQSVIGLAPDEEAEGPRPSDLIRNAVEAEGVSFAHQPVVIGLIDDSDIDAFAARLNAASGPVLAYCRSGLRAALMWALAEKSNLGEAAVIDIAARAGFDIAAYVGDDSEALLAA